MEPAWNIDRAEAPIQQTRLLHPGNGWTSLAKFSLLIAASLLSARAEHQDLYAKLLSPIASYSKPGQHFAIRTGTPVQFGKGAILPEGSILQGRVREAHRVGLGIRRERAQMELEFDRCSPSLNPAAPCTVELLDIENAREQVSPLGKESKNSRIQGILAAGNPNSLLQGIWFRPAGALLRRSPTGLTGPVGALQNHIAPNPIGAAVTIASRLLLFSLPDTEIELPAGTELIVRLRVPNVAPLALHAAMPPSEPLDEDRIAELQSIPSEIKNAAGQTVGDRVNFLFRGTREEIEAAFCSSGWKTADPLTRASFVKSYRAFTSLQSYSQAPVSPLFYQRGLPDFVFQKSMNTIAKRHHIRFWRVAGESDLWVAAATHDIGIAFDWNRFSLTHRINTFLDAERGKVLSDLASAHCLRRLTMVDRPAVSGKTTDGKLAVVDLSPCSPAALTYASVPELGKPRNPVHRRAARRMILEARQYATRSNAYYLAYRSARKAISAMRPGLAANGLR